MSSLQIDSTITVVIPDCTAGGDHLALAQLAYQNIISDGRILSDSRHCHACDLWVDLSFNGNPQRWEATMVDLSRSISL